jgi:hypothetical protein
VKLTKQGIRDLNNLPSRSTGRKLDIPESVSKDLCNHRWHTESEDRLGYYMIQRCEKCGEKRTLDLWR